jgi:trehalose transport system substrate-binding protein
MRRFLLTALAAALLASGCARAEEKSPDAPAPGDAAGKPVLTFYTALGQAEWKVMREEVIPPFEKAENCVVRSINVESGEMGRKLHALKQGGAMDVDVIGQDNMALWLLVQQDLMEDLTPYEASIPPETIDALVDVGRFDGKLYFMPYRPNVEITYYNESYLGKYGMKPPQDWDELMATARTLHEKEGVGRVAIKADGTAGATVHYFDFVNAAGGDPLKLNDAGSQRAFTYLKELWPHLSPESRRADFNTMNQFLAMESVYLGQNWPFGIEVIVNQGEKKDVKAYHGWRGPVREAHTLGGEVLGIPKGAPHKALALKFVGHMQSRATQTMLVRKLAWPPMREDAYAEVPTWQKPYFEAVKEALAHAVARPNVPYWEDFDKAINLAAREIFLDRADVKATLDKYAAVLEAAKARKGTGAGAAVARPVVATR